MAESTRSIDLKDCTIKFIDGTAVTPLEITIPIEEGNLTFTRARNVEYRSNRGTLGTTRLGDEVPCELTIEMGFRHWTATTGDNGTPVDFLTQEGESASNVSTGGNCQPYAIDIEVTIDNSDCDTIEDEVLTFSEFRYESIGGDLKAGTLNVSGKCLAVGPTSVRS